MDAGGKPGFGWNCALCMRCIYTCPEHAIEPRILKVFVIKEGFSLSQLQKKLEY
jgi:ferredoxin